MDQLTRSLAQIELTADDVIDTKHQIVNLDAKRHKNREALNCLRDQKPQQKIKNWVCVGDMFIRLNQNEARNIIFDDLYHMEQGVEDLRKQLTNKVNKLRELEGKPEVTGFNLKPLRKEEILSLRTAFKI